MYGKNSLIRLFHLIPSRTLIINLLTPSKIAKMKTDKPPAIIFKLLLVFNRQLLFLKEKDNREDVITVVEKGWHVMAIVLLALRVGRRACKSVVHIKTHQQYPNLVKNLWASVNLLTMLTTIR